MNKKIRSKLLAH